MDILHELTIVDILVVLAFSLMIIFTGGVIYLTAAEWRDRRRREQEKPRR